jgi:hypothetical protein
VAFKLEFYRDLPLRTEAGGRAAAEQQRNGTHADGRVEPVTNRVGM